VQHRLQSSPFLHRDLLRRSWCTVIGKAVNGTCLAPGQEETLTLGSDDPYQADFDDARVLIDEGVLHLSLSQVRAAVRSDKRRESVSIYTLQRNIS
jgi:hypothetical protein